MHRPRSVYTVAAAAALAIGAPLLTGCGSEPHAGAAAVVDGERITVSQVQARAEAVREAQRAAPDGDELIRASGPMARNSLNHLIKQRLIDRAARDEGIKVTRREVQEFRAAQEQRVGGAEQLREMLLRDARFAPDQIDGVMRAEVQINKLIAKLGGEPGSPEATQRLNTKLEETAEKLGVEVNPRYGTWNAKDWTLASDTTAWIKPPAMPGDDHAPGDGHDHGPGDGHDHGPDDGHDH